MKIWKLLICGLLAVGTTRADRVELKDGTRVEGRILAENPDSIEIQVGTNEAGTIRRILVIHASEISTWVSDKEGEIRKPDPGEKINRLAGTEHVERLLRQAEALIQKREHDEGIARFEEAAEAAVRNVDTLEPGDRLTALRMRAHALRLMLGALGGKEELLKARSKGILEELEARRKKLERDGEDLRDEKRAFENSEAARRGELGSTRKRRELDAREQELREKIEDLKREEATIGTRARMLEEEAVRTAGKITLVEERVDQAEDSVKQAERDARRR